MTLLNDDIYKISSPTFLHYENSEETIINITNGIMFIPITSILLLYDLNEWRHRPFRTL